MFNLLLALAGSYILYVVGSGKIETKEYWCVVLVYWILVCIKHLADFVKGAPSTTIEVVEKEVDKTDDVEEDLIEKLKKNSFEYEVNKIDYDRENEKEENYRKYMRILDGIEEKGEYGTRQY